MLVNTDYQPGTQSHPACYGQGDLRDQARHVLVGQSTRTRQVLKMIEKLGRCRWPGLLLGETGTGKEVVARLIHNISGPHEPFVTIDCSSMVGPLMESELFGHVKGAFTGAATAKMGLLEAANGGTAFLDEIGELPLDLQAKLLRVLQEKEFRPVGSLTTRVSDFRIVAATNRDLHKEVDKGTFRRDLYYRLNVINIRLAPLRERKDDIPALINHFIGRAATTYTMTAEAMEILLSYDWPGNVRELENCIQHMMAVNSGPLLHVADLPSNLQNHLIQKKSQYLMAAVGTNGAVTAGTPGPGAESAAAPVSLPGVIPLAELEKRAIINALEYTKGDRAIAAHLLGIGRTTLYRKLKEYQLEN
ncbi:MAG TPA: sigma-54 dependent transcriptional regulator [Bryobacteraceae bacterium]|nr:sigma-54 dependent transcriptional regulator [Bryobacteraceae bacterium]